VAWFVCVLPHPEMNANTIAMSIASAAVSRQELVRFCLVIENS
jgi:hypothetical protein